MTSPPDKLFRQGLEHYQKPAPGSAWERIESGLHRKRNRSPWMKIAAGLILLISTSAIFFQLNQPESTIASVSKESTPVSSQQLAVSSEELRADPVKDTVFAAGEQAVVSSGQLAVSSSKSMPPNPIAERSRSSRNESSTNSQQLAVPSSQASVAIHNSVTPEESHMAVTNEPAEIHNEDTPVTQVGITNEISLTEAASESKRTSITYSAEEVNAKYLKKESITEATPEKKNTSGLQKVIDLALDLKTEGSVLGEIREKKNEWLSFNIPSNKRETNK